MINNVSKTNKKCPNNTMQYVVKSGDTLYKIATRNKTTIELLLELNPELNANLLIPGIVMCVPVNVPVPPIAPPGGMPIPPIKPPVGMPVPPIAPPGGMPIPPIMPPEGFPVPPIAPPGGMPIPPIMPPEGFPVPPIAPPGGMPIPPIMPPEGFPVPPIAPPGGMPIPPIKPPTGFPVPPIAPPGGMPVPPGNMDCNGQMKYIIKQGDTLYNLAKKYDITLYELLNANKNVNPYNLQVGQMICIPMSTSKCPYGKVYTIVAGDTLASILTKFRISLANLKEVNENFDPYNIVIGSRICVPAFMAYESCPTDRTYVIKAGDNITKIAENFVVSTSDLLAANPNMRPEDFADVGLKICLPAESSV